MSKFCGKCGTEIKDGKCPKCDKTVKKTEKVKAEKVVKKTETKKVEVINEKASFAWAVLGFFVPIAGLVLFIVFMNKRKDLSKKAGIGALIGFIKNIIVIILSYVLSFVSFYSLFNFIESNPINVDPIVNDIVDIIEDHVVTDEEDDTITIELTDIDTNINFKSPSYSIRTFDELENKEYAYDLENIKVIRNNNKVVIKNYTSDEILFSFDNVKNAYYHEFDCSGIDTLLIVTTDKTYYIKTNVHVLANMKAEELKGDYVGYYYTYNHSYTCGGSIIALGKESDGSYYDLNGETGVDLSNLYYYDNYNNWINIIRGYKMAGKYGSVKAVISSTVSDTVYGIIDVDGYAYTYLFDSGSSNESVALDLIKNSPVKEIKYSNKEGIVTLVFENGEEYQFEYAEVVY